jgi:hypothetical protein
MHLLPALLGRLGLSDVGGRQAVLKRLSSDFRVDINHTMHTLDWIPPFSVAESMRWAFTKKL